MLLASRLSCLRTSLPRATALACGAVAPWSRGFAKKSSGSAADKPHGMAVADTSIVRGLNIFKDGADPQIKPDSEYPDWLWTMYVVTRTTSTIMPEPSRPACSALTLKPHNAMAQPSTASQSGGAHEEVRGGPREHDRARDETAHSAVESSTDKEAQRREIEEKVMGQRLRVCLRDTSVITPALIPGCHATGTEPRENRACARWHASRFGGAHSPLYQAAASCTGTLPVCIPFDVCCTLPFTLLLKPRWPTRTCRSNR